jgi:hypothetical protein
MIWCSELLPWWYWRQWITNSIHCCIVILVKHKLLVKNRVSTIFLLKALCKEAYKHNVLFNPTEKIRENPKLYGFSHVFTEVYVLSRIFFRKNTRLIQSTTDFFLRNSFAHKLWHLKFVKIRFVTFLVRKKTFAFSSHS